MFFLDNVDKDFVIYMRDSIQKLETIVTTLPKNIVALYLSSYCSLPTYERVVINKLWKQIIPAGFDMPVTVYKGGPYDAFISSQYKKVTDNADFVTIDKPYSKIISSEWSFPFYNSLVTAVYNEQTLLRFLSDITKIIIDKPTYTLAGYNAIAFKMKTLDNIKSVNVMIGREPERPNSSCPYFYMWDNVMKSILDRNAEKTASAIFYMTHMSLIKYQTYVNLITEPQFRNEVIEKIQQIRNQSLNGLAITPPIKTKIVEPTYKPYNEKYKQAIASLDGDTDFTENEIIGIMHTKGIERVDADYEGMDFIRTCIYNGDRYGLCKKNGKIYGVSSDGNTVLTIDIPNQHKYEFVNQLAEMLPSGYEAYSANSNDSEIIKSIWDTNLI